MASAEEELPEELDKLQITPNLSQRKLMDNNLILALNPFFDGEEKTIPTVVERISAPSTPITSKCSVSRLRGLRVRRASEGMTEERNNVSSTNANEEDCKRTPPTGGVLKQTLKKSTSSSTGTLGQRKLVLREPILKALQTCLRPQSSVRRSIIKSSGAQAFDFTNQTNVNDSALTIKGMIDFRDLIHECHSLLTEDVDFSARSNKISLCIRNSKNFTTMQSSQASTNHGGQLRHNRTYHKPQDALSNSTASDGRGSCGNDNQLNTKSALNLPRNCLSSSPEQTTTSARYITSCSQQAGSSVPATACDDVTIDELASYFDTLVHIPKKMSSMAEMMYI